MNDLGFLNSDTRETDRSRSEVEPYKMRCPGCRKLYTVSRLSDDDTSRFECVSCQSVFYALKPDAGLVLRTALLETQLASIFDQPSRIDSDFIEARAEANPESRAEVLADIGVGDSRTTARSALVATELKSTTEPLYREEQAQFAKDVSAAESAELVKMWQGVMSDYTNERRHAEFVMRCFREQQLAFAAHKYAQLLVVAPQEEIARKMRSQIQGLASYGFDETANGLSFATWQFPLPSFNNLLIFMGAVLVVVGFGFPNMRQTAGLGVSMIALAIGLRVFLRRPRA